MTERTISPSAQIIRRRREQMDADGWLFVKWVCGHGDLAVERFHRPLFYVYAGDITRLAACLNRYDSEIVTQVKADLMARGIDWNTAEGRRQMVPVLRRINLRCARSFSKTTLFLDAMLWLASRDPSVPAELASPSGPELTIALASKSDPVAQDKFCSTIGGLMLTDAYRAYYPDRLYSSNTEGYITKKWIRMNGQSKASDQETFEARGVKSQWPANHYRIIGGDDLTGTEEGDASVDDARGWISRLHGISIAEGLGGSRHIIIGTISGAKDEHAVLRNNPAYLTIVVPIWKKSVPANLANVMVDGVPTLPEWYSLDDIRAKRADTLTIPGVGAVSWLQNFELSAAEAGSMQFSSELIQRAKFVWVYREIGLDRGVPIVRRLMRRYRWNGDGSPRLTERKPSPEPCMCWMRCDKRTHDYVEYDPLTLPRYLGVDQSFALRGDKWAISPMCVDPEGFTYWLKTASGRGYRNMIPAIPMMFKRLGGDLNPPRKVGIESNAVQGVTADWIKRDRAFQFLARHLEPVSPGMTQKEVRIFNNILANLEMGALLLDPEDSERDQEMLAYDASDDDPDDNIIDSGAIAYTVATARPTMDGDEDIRRQVAADDAMYARDIDGSTGIDLTDYFSEVM